MCGICGVIGGDVRQVEPAVRSMMRAMVHRGPDDEGYEPLPMSLGEDGPVAGFGFRRLSILDCTPAGHQPMFNADTGDCLIFNGEIYNFRSLRAELQLNGVLFRSTGDTEVLLQALSVWGDAALEKIQGMYALAFYHAATRRVLLARDPLGIKPLYTARLADQVVFASEVRALLASGIVPTDLDPSGIAGMLAYGAVQSPGTIYKAIRSFPAGTAKWIDGGPTAAPARRFWHFPSRPLAGIDVRTAATEVRTLIHDSVLRHLVSDVPVGVFLSAGIDSTIIASFAREYSPQVTAFTVGFGALTLDDESEIAANTAASLGIKHVILQLNPNLHENWRAWMAGMDSPSIDGFNTFLVSKRVAEEGVVVGLSGLGADELFGGYPSFSRAPGWSPLIQAAAFIPAAARASAIRSVGLLTGKVGAAEKLADLASGDPTIAGITRSLRRTLSNRTLASLGLAARGVGLADDYLGLGSSRMEPDLNGDGFNNVSRLELTHYMGDTLLRDTDINSMRQSLEVRVPFLDLPLIDYVSALPGSIKRQRGEPSKSLLRAACTSVLREEVVKRPKTGFVLPIGAWMRGTMREYCESAIDRLAQVPEIEGQHARQVWNRFVADPRSIHWSRPLSLVVLGNYLR